MKQSLIILSFFVLGACIDEHDIHLTSEPPRIVIDGVISNRQGESYVNVGWSTSANVACRDSFGYRVRCEPETFGGPYKVIGLARIIENEGARTIELPFRMNDKEGMILLKPEITGSPGYKYELELEIQYDGAMEYYSASTEMLPTPEITNIAYEIRKGDVGKSDDFVPLISFTDPGEENFYLFELCRADLNYVYCENSRAWNYSIIADTFLPSVVQGLSIDDGASIAKYAEFYPDPQVDAGAQVRMYSVDRSLYDFYKSLLDQFNNDGGAFSPTPAMPKGNISGNGIGFFRALQESSASVYYH